MCFDNGFSYFDLKPENTLLTLQVIDIEDEFVPFEDEE